MKKIIIVSPHFVPSNLTAVHRSRIFSNHLAEFGWEPVIICVHEDYYEEKPDHDLEKLLKPGLRIEKTKAWRVHQKIRLIGDIGLRGFRSLYKRILEIARKENPDFLLIEIPSFYAALLGRLIHARTGIPYGVDYIDPWVHRFPGSEKIFSRHWFSTKIAGILEPIAVKHASLICGVAAGYYSDVIKRNPHLEKSCVTGSMPYGGEKNDHEIVRRSNIQPYLFQKQNNKFQFIYAGAFLPKAYEPLKKVFKSIAENKELFADVVFHFIGTGKITHDAESYSIKPLAEEFGLWNKQVREYPLRIPYLDVLVHLEAADAVFVLGSTEAHYTPSKLYQGILSDKPVLAVLHEKSTAVDILKQSAAGVVLAFNGENDTDSISKGFSETYRRFTEFAEEFDPQKRKLEYFDQFSAKEITRQLAALLDKALQAGGRS